MPTAISGTSSPSSSIASTSGINTMTGADFLNLMIMQLQQQDPLNPTDSNQLLTQLSQISTLQSNAAMESSLKGLTLQQSIGAGGNLIGKTVQGIDGTGNTVQGIVTSVKVQDKKVLLETDGGGQLPLENVTTIATTSPAVASAAGLGGLLSNAASGTADGTAAANTPNLSTLFGLLSSLGAK
jgi:flagellar basal-body rod modification protein FlgD